MARAPRQRVPSSDTDNGDMSDQDLAEYDHPGLNAWRKSGDASALMDPSFAEWEWTVYRLHTPDEIVRLRPATPRLWLGRNVGPLDLQAVQGHYGGGTFEFWGKFDGNLLARIRQDLAGPRKDFNATPAPAAAAAAAGTTDPGLLRLLENQQRTLDALVAKSNTPAAAAVSPTFMEMLELFDRMKPHAPSEGQMGEIVSAFKEGIALRDALGGQPERDKLDIILERVMPSFEKVAGQMLAGAAAARRAPPRAPARPASSATVVDPGGAAGPAVTVEPGEVVDPGDHRMRTAVEVVANAIANGEDPGDTAATVESILQPQELYILRQMSDADVVTTLRTSAGGQFPVLEHAEAPGFIAAVLADLRQPLDTTP